VWELADGRSVSVLETGTPLGLVAFSPDGRRLLAAGAPIAKLSRTLPPSRILGSQVARVWELETGKELLAVRGSRYAAFSPDGRRVALAGPLQYARIVDLARGREVGVLKVFQGEAVAVAFSGQGDKVLAFTTEKAVHVWDAFTGQELTSVRSGVEPFTSASFDPEGRRVLATSEDGTARLFDAESGKEVLALRGHTGPVRDARFDATGARLLTVSDDRTARVWEPTAALDRLVPRMTGGRLNALIPAGFAPLAAVSPDGRRLLTRTLLESSIWAWDLEKRARMASWRAPVQPYVTAFGPDSRFAAFATAEGFVRVVDLRSGAVHAQYQQGTGRWVEALAVAPGGDLIVLVTRPIVRRRQQPERALQAELVGVKGVRPPVVLKHEDAVRGAAFDGLGRSVVTWSDDRVVAVWDGVTGELRCRLTGHDGPVTGAVLSPDGASVLTTSADRTARLWGVPDGQPRELLRGFEDAVLGAAFAPDGRRAVAWSKDHTALLWELGKPGDAVTLRGHEKPVVAGAFSPDGRRLVTGSEDHTARVWAADTGAPWSTYRGHDQALRAAVFGPDGREVVTVSLDSVVRLWPIDLLRAAQAFCPRELTPLERARYEVKERY
jgi:WD40 repeat protein